jgi:predicted TIM-barrel fold metal-dependent hydrolase
MRKTMAKAPIPFTRRRLLLGGAIAAADFTLSGCHPYPLQLPTPPPPSVMASPLTIDVHCHIFNGTDLPVYNFLTEAFAVPEPEAALARDVVQLAGVTGTVEKNDLQEKLGQGTPAAAAGRIHDHIHRQRQQTYHNVKGGVLERLDSLGPKERQSYHDAFQANSPEEFTKRLAQVTPPPPPPASARQPEDCANTKAGHGYSLLGAIGMLFQYCAPRIVSAQDYLNTFCPDAHRGVDLMLASMVDFDWWLSGGSQQITSLETQLDVMELISVLSGGRVHGFFPYCPLRAVAHKAGHVGTNTTDWCPLQEAQKAVRSRGCVGIKLYPPMGFAPYGNSRLDSSPGGDPNFWVEAKLPPWAYQPIAYQGTSERLGLRLDEALDELYKWCIDEHVPILAHSNATNGRCAKYKALAGADYWALVLAQYPDLRVNFGHLGGLTNCFDGIEPCPAVTALPPTSQQLINLMPAHTNVYGDAAFMDTMLHHPNEFDALLGQAYRSNEILKSRFLFGTDWSLLMETGGNKPYLDDFVKAFSKIDELQGAASGFFGGNAIAYLGLQNGGRARGRLEDFYGTKKVANPAWMLKVDQLSAKSS